MAPPGDRPHFQERFSALSVEDSVAKLRGPSSKNSLLHDFNDIPRLILAEEVVPIPKLSLNLPFHDGPVNLLDRSLSELLRKSGSAFARLSEDNDPGNGPIEPMNQADENIPRLQMSNAQIFPDPLQQGRRSGRIPLGQ
jgi:hypothetical protein